MNLAQVSQDIALAYQPPPTGRPAAIGNADTVQELLEAVEAGNYLETAAELTGIAPNTVRNWVKRGEDGETPYDLFMRAFKRAAARAEAIEVGKVRTAGSDPRFWAASMTYLERRHPERWARRQDGNDGPKVVVQIGVRDSDVQVQITSVSPIPDTFACSTQPLSVDTHSLSEARESDNPPYVTPSKRMPAARKRIKGASGAGPSGGPNAG